MTSFHKNNFIKNKDIFSLFTLLLLIILLTGCASTGVKPDQAFVATMNMEQEEEKDIDLTISDFIIGIGDEIDITVYRHDDLNRSVKIDPTGKILFPLIGEVQVNGISIFALKHELTERLSKYIVDPQVDVNIKSIQSQKVMVLGEVNNPGVIALDTRLRVFDAIAKAGGTGKDAKLKTVFLIRNGKEKQETFTLDLKKTVQGKDYEQDMLLASGDIVYLPATNIAKVGRFSAYLTSAINSMLNLGSGIVIWDRVLDIIQGNQGGGSVGLTTTARQ